MESRSRIGAGRRVNLSKELKRIGGVWGTRKEGYGPVSGRGSEKGFLSTIRSACEILKDVANRGSWH